MKLPEMSSKLAVLAICLIAADSVPRVHAQEVACPQGVLRAIDGNSASIADPPEPALVDDAIGAGFELVDNGLIIETALKGPFPAGNTSYYQRAWLSPVSFDGDGPSLAYEVRGCTTDCLYFDEDDKLRTGLQKINHHFLYSDPVHGLEFGERRYIGFALRVTRDNPVSKPILFQLWQGAPHGPPMAGRLRTESDGSLTLFIDIANNDTQSNPSAPRVEAGAIRNFEKDVWYSMHLALFPEHENLVHRPGNVTLQLNYRKQDATHYTNAFTYYGKWGYVPGDGCVYAGECGTEGPNERIDFKFGIYRPAEDTALQVRFDSIKMADTSWMAFPEYACEWN